MLMARRTSNRVCVRIGLGRLGHQAHRDPKQEIDMANAVRTNGNNASGRTNLIGGVVSQPESRALPTTERERSSRNTVRFWLHAEGAAALVAAAILYQWLDGSWLFAIPLLLLPDVSMVGYLAGQTVGSFSYNLVHNWAVGLAVLGLGAFLGSDLLLLAGTVLVGHVGMDRLVGYGLKYPTTFKDTHLQRL
jgi:hypothetical protein